MAKQTPCGPQGSSAQWKTVLLALHWPNEALRRGIVHYARSRRWHLLDLQCYSMKLPRSARADGVIFDLLEEQEPLARTLLSLGIPTVQIEDHVSTAQCPCVIRDRIAIGRAAAEHFAGRGFRRTAYMRSPQWKNNPDERMCEGFVKHTRRLGGRTHIFELQRLEQFVPWAQVDLFVAKILDELTHMQPPVGVFTYHDMMAARLCHFFEEAGLSVPEEVAVLGMGNNPLLCDCAPVPLSSVDPNFYGQGQTVARLLGRLMAGKPAPSLPVLVRPIGVVTRQSTDVLSVPNVYIARAVRYLWEHLAEPLSVRDVAEAVGVSRRKLEQDFRTSLGRSVIEELNRKRIERCCELLRGTRQTVVSIARQVGFRTEPYLFRVFRKIMGMTPLQYRRTHASQQGEAKGPQTPGRN